MNTIYISLFYTYAAERICRKRGAPARETPLFSFLYSFDSGKHLRAPDLSEEAYPSDASYSMT